MAFFVAYFQLALRASPVLNPTEIIAFSAPVLLVAYSVFGMTGFGATIISVPILIQVIPLQFAVPLSVLFDMTCTAVIGGSNWRLVSLPEMKRLFPWMLIGIALGTILLDRLGTRWPLIALGGFVLAVCARGLLAGKAAPKPSMQPFWALPFGLIGGVFSALFGTGGPIYTIYLARQLTDVDRFRATIAVVILISGITRVITFGSAGFYTQDSILLVAAALLPIALLGAFVGSKLRTRVSQVLLKKLIFVLLVAAGASALFRGLASPA